MYSDNLITLGEALSQCNPARSVVSTQRCCVDAMSLAPSITPRISTGALWPMLTQQLAQMNGANSGHH